MTPTALLFLCLPHFFPLPVMSGLRSVPLCLFPVWLPGAAPLSHLGQSFPAAHSCCFSRRGGRRKRSDRNRYGWGSRADQGKHRQEDGKLLGEHGVQYTVGMFTHTCTYTHVHILTHTHTFYLVLRNTLFGSEVLRLVTHCPELC